MRLRLGSARMQHIRLTHPDLDFYVDVAIFGDRLEIVFHLFFPPGDIGHRGQLHAPVLRPVVPAHGVKYLCLGRGDDSISRVSAGELLRPNLRYIVSLAEG